MPKGVWCLRALTEFYYEVKQPRSLLGLRLMYGLTPKITLMLTPYFSNHHGKALPAGFVNHYHKNNTTVYFTSKQYGLSYPYLFSGANLYAKFRFLSLDGQGTHFRAAVYGELSGGKIAHDEAEPSLMGDNSGYGGGFIVTQLYKRLAVSLTTGLIFPEAYSEQTSRGVFTTVEYSRAVNYSISFGYLLYPKEYRDYRQVNYNLYVEFIGKKYGSAVIRQNSDVVEATGKPLQEGAYLEARPGVQRIINSNDRIDFSVGFDLAGRSYTRFYPVYWIAYQRYFY
jgi:hypothetical protein